MNQITMQSLENSATMHVAFGGATVVQQRDGLKIGGKQANLRYFLRRAHKEIIVRSIQPAQRPDYIARVGADAKLGHAPDIDRDFHGVI
jgi:hypothetical protein